MTGWQPSASMDVLKKRAELLRCTRQFFADRLVMEVDVPLLGATTVTDLHIESIGCAVNGTEKYLQGSPEYFMKRLLAADSGAIFYLGKAFRDGEAGRRHSPEFTMLEWYRPGWTEQQLITEVAELVKLLLSDSLVLNDSLVLSDSLATHHFSYREAFHSATSLDAHGASLAELQQLAGEIAQRDCSADSRSTCLDLIFSLAVEPQLPPGLVFIDNYPACQSALAVLEKDATGELVARRFEAFLNGLELANGYYELTDPIELRSRFQADLALRLSAGKSAVSIDENLLAAMTAGLPDCAGVALGMDRLLMQLVGVDDIRQVMAFGH